MMAMINWESSYSDTIDFMYEETKPQPQQAADNFDFDITTHYGNDRIDDLIQEAFRQDDIAERNNYQQRQNQGYNPLNVAQPNQITSYTNPNTRNNYNQGNNRGG